MTKTITVAQFHDLGIEVNPHNDQIISEAVNLADTVKQLGQAAEVLVSVYQAEDGCYFQHVIVKLIHDSLDLTITFNDYRKKYYIGCQFTHYKNIDNYAISNARERFDAPNTIGKLNAKKIADWIEYYSKVDGLLKIKSEENGSEKEAFLKSLEGLNVQWFGTNKNRGEVVLNGIKLSFTIEPTYISKKMEIYYQVPNTVESFKMLADNQYKPKK